MVTRNNRSHSAFTLIELLVVIVVIAVLAAIVLPKFNDTGKRSKEATLKSNLALLRNAVALFNADTGAYPAALDDLKATTAPASGKNADGSAATITASDWHGPYVQGNIPNDPISNAVFTYLNGTVKSSAGAPYDTW